MGAKRTPVASRQPVRIKAIAAVAGLGLIVVGVCVAARLWTGPETAEAQAPQPAATRSTPPAVRSGGQVPQPTTTSTPPQQLNVMAIVNGEQITRQQLANEALNRFGKDVLESLVNKHLILQACKQQGAEVTSAEVEAEITRMAGKFGLSKDRWLEMLQQERNINPQQYRNDIIWPTLALRKLSADRLVISQDEIAKARESEYGPKRQVRMIMIKDAARAKQIHQYLVAKPEEFGKVAKDYSDDKPSASARGLIPPVRKHVGDPTVEKAVFALAEGQVSDVVVAQGQHFIFMCEKHIEAATATDEQWKQVEARLKDKLIEDRLRDEAGNLFKALQDKAQIVNVYNQPQLKESMPGVAATINGQKLTMRQLADECIKRHGVDVLEGEVNRVLLQQHLKKANAQVTQQDINAEVARAAIMYGFVKADGSADVEKWLQKVIEEDNATIDLYVQDAVWPSVALKKLVAGKVEVTSEDLKKAYDANYGDQVDVLVCVLGSQRRAQEVWELARANSTDAFFGDLANQYSIEPTSKYNFGKVPPIRQNSGQPLIEKEAFSLKPGDLSGIVALGDKFVIMRCLGREEGEGPEMEAVKEELHADIEEKKLRIAMRDRFDAIRQSARIDNYLAGTTQVPKANRSSNVAPASAVRPVPGFGGSAQPAGGTR